MSLITEGDHVPRLTQLNQEGTLMLMTLIQKEMMHHILSARFVALLLMCVLLIPLNLHINYHHYLKRQIDYQEQETLEDENVFKDENSEEPGGISVKFKLATDTDFEVSKADS